MARLIGMYVENFAKLRLMDIVIKRGVNLLTGKNGQGKSSAIDAVKVGIIGQKALPVKPLRKGAERYKIVTKTDEFTVTRTGGESGIPTLTLEMAKGATRDDTPQKFLDRFKTALTFDPLAFIGMDLEEQLAMLHKLSGVTLDFKELDAAEKADYDARSAVNREHEGPAGAAGCDDSARWPAQGKIGRGSDPGQAGPGGRSQPQGAGDIQGQADTGRHRGRKAQCV